MKRTPEDGLGSKNYSDFQLEAEGVPSPPTTFKVELADDKQHLRFTFRSMVGASRARTSTYRVYFASHTLVDTVDELNRVPPDPLPTAVQKHLNMVESLFASATLVGSIDANRTGAESTFLNRDFVGADGYFFGVSANLMGQESPPSPPVYNPSITLTAAQSAVPGDVTEAQATFTKVESGGSVTLNVIVAARPPANDEAFAGYQIFFQNYQNSDSTFMSYTEGPRFRLPKTLPSSGLLEGTFPLSPDTPAVYTTGTIDITTANTRLYESVGSTAEWSAGWGNSRRVQFIHGSDPTSARFDVPILSVTTAPPSGQPYMTVPLVIGRAWQTTKNTPYAVYLKGSTGMDGNVVAPHKVRLLFVALSHAGTHRSDILDSVGTPLVPYVEFPWGFTASLGMPLNPSGFTATAEGATCTLSWWVITSGSVDTTIASFNIYRVRTGIVSSHPAQTRPVAPFDTVYTDRSNHVDGYYQYTDKKFNISSTIPETTAVTGWDFNTADLGCYTYWITSVNTEGLENPGIVTTDFTCMGNTGDEDDPSVNRDSVFNRLYNSEFYIQTAASADVTLNVPFGHAYTSAVGLATHGAATDGQIVWWAFNPGYKFTSSDGGEIATGQVRNLGGITGGYNGTDYGAPTSTNDAFSVWETYTSGTGAATKFRYTGGVFNGEITLYGGTAPPGDVAFGQYAHKDKFVYEENLWLTAQVRKISGTAPTGTFQMGIKLHDSTLGDGAWVERWDDHGEWAVSSIITDQEPYVFGTKLPTTAIAGTYDRVTTYFRLISQLSAGCVIGVAQPMLNGGAKPAKYTTKMSHYDVPGGSTTGGGEGVPPGGCVTGDTLIKTANGSQLAKDIREGATVFSWTKHGRLPNKVDKVVGTQAKTIIHLSTNGAHLYCTPTHRVAVRKTARIAYVKADALELGDVIITSDGFQSVDRAIEVKEILHLQTPVEAFDFHLARDPHNYIASGVVCHNKQKYQEGEV
jgi:hypothetical protein